MIKILGKPIKRVVNEDGDSELTISIDNYRNQQLIKELDKEKTYRIQFEEVKSKRSIEQNKLMWKLIHDISQAINGSLANDEDDWEIYLQALEKAGAKYEYIACLPEGEKILKEQFRAVKFMNSFEHKGKTFNQYKVYYGSSKFNSSEMNTLINTIMDMAAECGVDTTYYEGGL